MDVYTPDGELLVRIDTKLELLMKMFDGLKLDVQRDFDEVWIAIERTRTDVGELQKFRAEIQGASRSVNWLTHLLISLPFGAIAGAVGFFVSK